MKRHEYIYASGNGNRSDTLRGNNPEFITWVLIYKWINEPVSCLGEYNLDDYGTILDAKDVTKEFRAEFEACRK